MRYFWIGVVFLSAVFGLAGCSTELETASTSVAETATVPIPDIQPEDSQVLAVVKQYTDALKSGDRKSAESVLYTPPKSKRRVEEIDTNQLQAHNVKMPPWYDFLRENRFSEEQTSVLERTPDRYRIRAIGSLLDLEDAYWFVDFELVRDAEAEHWRIKEIEPKPGGLRSLDELNKQATQGSI